MTARVVSVSGPPGSGKTTLARGLAQALGWRLIEYDRFETFTERPLPEVLDWIARDAPYDALVAPGLAEALQASPGPVVLDTPLGRADPAAGRLIALSIWIDCPADVALARKIAQLAGQVPASGAAGFLDWLRGYLALHHRITRPACAIQAERVRPLADLRLDGLGAADAMIADVAETVRRTLPNCATLS